MNATDDRLEKFEDIKDENRRTYAAMMSAMDDAIGRVLATLREKKLEDNTLVFFISDNGGPTMPGTTINASSNASAARLEADDARRRHPCAVLREVAGARAGRQGVRPTGDSTRHPADRAGRGRCRSSDRCEARRRRPAAVSQRQEQQTSRTRRCTGASAIRWRFARAIGNWCVTIPSSTA